MPRSRTRPSEVASTTGTVRPWRSRSRARRSWATRSSSVIPFSWRAHWRRCSTSRSGLSIAELSEHSGYVPLAQKVGDTEANEVTALALPGINVLPVTVRVDPAGSLAAPLIGAVGAESTGQSGLEYQYNSLLAGRNGAIREEVSPDGVPLPGKTTRSSPTIPGDRRRAHHRRAPAVRHRAVPGRRDPGVARQERHRHRDEHPDRRDPVHGQPGGQDGSAPAPKPLTTTAIEPAYVRAGSTRRRPRPPPRRPPLRRPSPPWSRPRRTSPSRRSTSPARCSSW